MPASLAILVVDRRRARQVVQRALLDAVGVRNFLLAITFLHTFERLDALPFHEPASPVQVQVLLAVVDGLLLQASDLIEAREEILVVFEVRRAQRTRIACPGRVAFAIGIEFAEFAVFLKQFFLCLPSLHTEAALLGFGNRQDFFQS